MSPTEHQAVSQLRLVVETEDFEKAVHFYRDVLGLTELAAFEADGEAKVIILEAGKATLELANPAQKKMIDDIEGAVSPKIRVAFEVDNARGVTDSLVEAGADLLASPVETPWQSLNSRLNGPAGLQLTIFEELTSLPERERGQGFGTQSGRADD